MIGFVQGKVDTISEDNVVIDTGAIGYNVRISAKTAQELPGIGQEKMKRSEQNRKKPD